MPSTVNGIGTHYYGKSNYSTRVAPCGSCKRVGNLESYDTRLWFVVVFIPVIPLGRKRIIDKCPSCTRHYAVNADVYEQSKQLQTSGSLEQFRREPSPDAALAAHGQLLAFREQQQAAGFRKTALERFPGHAPLRAGLAAQLRDMAEYDESARLFQEALLLDRELPEARIGVANRKMAAGQLDEAKKLLDFLCEPGASRQYSLAPVDILAANMQRAGRHEEALQLAEVLRRELPKLEDNHQFRTFVKKSEQALQRSESILPPRSLSVSGLFRSEGSPYPSWLRKLAIAVVAVVLLLGGLAVNNEYIRRHRTLHVVNATGQPAQVQVDGGAPVSVGGLGRITVSEGPHVVKVSGPVTESHNIALKSDYFARWFSNPAWVLNVGGEGVLEDITHVYAANPTPGSRQLLVGETFFTRPHIDYIFTDAPSQVSVSDKNQEVTKTEIGWHQADDVSAFLTVADTRHDAAMTFAEKRLRRNPRQTELLQLYLNQSKDTERDRVEAFLKSGIDRRPIDVAWHRTYQSLAEMSKHGSELVATYDRLLAADPSNAALLYLRGRIDPDWKLQDTYYQRAIAADPKLGWPWMAMAARAGTEGRWDESLKAALEAQKRGLGEPERIPELIHEARLARGEAKALVDEYRPLASSNARDVQPLLFLIDALAATDRGGEIEPAINAWVLRLPPDLQGQAAPHLRALGLYAAGRLADGANYCQSNGQVKATPVHMHSLLALGRMEQATDEAMFGRLWGDPMNVLAVSVGFSAAGRTQEAARWREKAVGALGEFGGQSDVAKAARLLSGSKAPTLEEARRIYFPPGNKAVFLAALADRYPAQRATFLAEAARFNFSRRPSYQLIKRAMEKAPPALP